MEPEKNLQVALQHKLKGNNCYKAKCYDDALNEYEIAMKYCPNNDVECLSILYSNQAACYIAMEQYELAVEACGTSLEFNDKWIKSYWRRAESYRNLEKYYDAQCDLKTILEIEPNNKFATSALSEIEPLVREQFEQQKQEVMQKLTTFANWGLGKIGLSTDNFEWVQPDPNNPNNWNIKFTQ